MITYNYLSLANIFSEYQVIYDSDKPQFLLQQHIDLNEIITVSFQNISIHQRAKSANTL